MHPYPPQTPHLRVTLGSSPAGVHVGLDYTPRDDLAYMTGNDYLEEFYDASVQQAFQQAVNDPAVTST